MEVNRSSFPVAFLFVMLLCLADSKKKLTKSIQQTLINLDDYHKQDPPSTDTATEVQLGIRVNSFYSISEGTMDYMVSFYLRQRWQDKRLAYKCPSDRHDTIKLGHGTWTEIWLPDTFFRNEKKANFHDVTVDNRMLRLNCNGTVWYVTKISATFSCPMKLQKYPLDTQRCPITIESFGYTTDTMYFAWWPQGENEEPTVDIGQNKQLPQFTLVGYDLQNCAQNYTAGTYTCLAVDFILRRDIGFFLIQVYVPSILIVILSWVSFWINIESSPARVSIGLLTVLTTTTMSAGARASLPRVSYIKAIDVWMIICLIFVFASLIEYAVVNVISRKQPSKKKAAPTAATTTATTPAAATQVETGKKDLCKCIKDPKKPAETDGKKKAQNIDKLSRQCFPLAFVLFNIIYWTAYTFPLESGDTQND